MTQHELKRQLKAALRHTDYSLVSAEHLEQVKQLAKKELSQKTELERIGFAQFLCAQVRFIGWRIWLAQAILLAVICGFLAASMGEYYLINPRYAAQALCCLSVLVLMTALPFISRALKYKMHEIEAATRFSSVRLLMARLLIIGVGDLFALCGFWCVATLKTPLPAGSALLYSLFPFLLASCGLLFLLGNLPAARFAVGSTAMCCALLTVYALLGRLYPAFYRQTFTALWIVVCAALAALCVIQARQIVNRARYTELQLA